MKQYRYRLFLTCFVILIPMFIGLLVWNQLPDMIPTHFNFNGVVDGYSSKFFGIVGLPLFLLFIHILCMFGILNDPKKNNINNKMLTLVFWSVPLISLFVNGAIICFSLGLNIDIRSISYLLVGVSFVLIGNYMSKNRVNYTVGIKIPWTLNSDNNWYHTHRLASKLWVIGGLLILMNIFLQYSWLMFVVIIVCGIVPLIYSFIYYKRHDEI